MTLPPMIRKGARRYVVRVVLMVLMVHVVRVVRVVHVVHVVRVVRVVRVVHVWYMWYVWYVWYILTCSTCGARGTCGTYGVCGTCGTGGMCTVRTHACCYWLNPCLLLLPEPMPAATACYCRSCVRGTSWTSRARSGTCCMAQPPRWPMTTCSPQFSSCVRVCIQCRLWVGSALSGRGCAQC